MEQIEITKENYEQVLLTRAPGLKDHYRHFAFLYKEFANGRPVDPVILSPAGFEANDSELRVHSLDPIFWCDGENGFRNKLDDFTQGKFIIIDGNQRLAAAACHGLTVRAYILKSPKERKELAALQIKGELPLGYKHLQSFICHYDNYDNSLDEILRQRNIAYLLNGLSIQKYVKDTQRGLDPSKWWLEHDNGEYQCYSLEDQCQSPANKWKDVDLY